MIKRGRWTLFRFHCIYSQGVLINPYYSVNDRIANASTWPVIRISFFCSTKVCCTISGTLSPNLEGIFFNASWINSRFQIPCNYIRLLSCRMPFPFIWKNSIAIILLNWYNILTDFTIIRKHSKSPLSIRMRGKMVPDFLLRKRIKIWNSQWTFLVIICYFNHVF